MRGRRQTVPGLPIFLSLLSLSGCKHEATVGGSVRHDHGQPAMRATVSMACPGEAKHVTSTNAGGDFRFEDVGPGVDGACTVEVEAASIGGAPKSVASRCVQSDKKSGLCTEAFFAFDLGP